MIYGIIAKTAQVFHNDSGELSEPGDIFKINHSSNGISTIQFLEHQITPGSYKWSDIFFQINQNDIQIISETLLHILVGVTSSEERTAIINNQNFFNFLNNLEIGKIFYLNGNIFFDNIQNCDTLIECRVEFVKNITEIGPGFQIGIQIIVN